MVPPPSTAPGPGMDSWHRFWLFLAVPTEPHSAPRRPTASPCLLLLRRASRLGSQTLRAPNSAFCPSNLRQQSLPPARLSPLHLCRCDAPTPFQPGSPIKFSPWKCLVWFLNWTTMEQQFSHCIYIASLHARPLSSLAVGMGDVGDPGYRSINERFFFSLPKISEL